MDHSDSNPLPSANGAVHRGSRRRWLQLTGSAAVLLPVVHLTGCAEEAPAPAAATPQPAPAAQPPAAVESAPQTAAEAATESVAEAAPSAPGPGLVKIEESDPIAKALNYVHDAGTVDPAKQPRFAAGQNCVGCAQYKADDAAGWGGCAIFPGKLVADNGWCAGFIAAS